MTAQPLSHSLSPLCRVPLAFFAAALFLLLGPSAAHASIPNYKGSSNDGSIVFFETDEQLVPGDTDTKRDVYERDFDSSVGAYVTREISLGPTGGNDAYPAQFEGASSDGKRVFFTTQERLVAEDTDDSLDLYMRNLETGTTTLVSRGAASCWPGCGNGGFPVTFAGVNEAGTEAFFETKERLAATDTDSSTDIYVRDLGPTESTAQVSVGEASCQPGCGNGAFDVSGRGVSADGTHAFFTTEESLSSADTDTAADIYARDLQTGATSLVSQGECGGCGSSGAVPIFDGSSANGKRVFFSTDEKLVGADGDTATDVYGRDLSGATTFLISKGTENVTASYAATSADGTHVFFSSAEGLLPEDTNHANDVYEWTGGSLQWITSAPCSAHCGSGFDAVSADSTQVLFSTAESLLPEDTDASADIYRQNVAGGAPVLVSRGESSCPACWNGAFDARFNDSSADASRVVFTTAEGLIAEDTDGEDDIYLRDIEANAGVGTSSLITTSPSYCPLKKGNCGATYVGSSDDGLRVFFRTVERFTLEDGDNEADIYERDLGSFPPVTRLVSTGNDPNLNLGPEAPTLTGTDPASPDHSTTPRVLGEAKAGSRVKLYTSPDCSGEPVASGTAEQLHEPGLAASVASGSLTTFRATAEDEGFVSTCSAPISYEQLALSGGGGEGGGGSSSGGGSNGGSGGTSGGGSRTGLTYVTPRTRITFAPAAKTRSRSPVFRFTDSTGQEGTTFRCKVDRKPWKGCSSPLRLKRLAHGKHVLEVTAVNAVGAQEPLPVRRAFKVVR